MEIFQIEYIWPDSDETATPVKTAEKVKQLVSEEIDSAKENDVEISAQLNGVIINDWRAALDKLEKGDWLVFWSKDMPYYRVHKTNLIE